MRAEKGELEKTDNLKGIQTSRSKTPFADRKSGINATAYGKTIRNPTMSSWNARSHQAANRIMRAWLVASVDTSREQREFALHTERIIRFGAADFAGPDSVYLDSH